MSENPITVLNLWISRVNAMAVDDLLALYDDDAVLFPTFSDALLTNKQAIRGYFEELGGQPSIEVAINEGSVTTQSFSASLHTIGGTYDWRFDKTDDAMVLEARFTFVLDLARSSPILHHHSSQLPHKS
ncbi:MAG: nuclear transport factor 2 family protein [Opitutales bacterium]